MVCRLSGIDPHLCSAVSLEFHRVDLVEADDTRWLVDEDEGLGTVRPAQRIAVRDVKICHGIACS